MNYRAVETTGEYVARLETDADWRAEIEPLAIAADADAARFTALDAVRGAKRWFFHRDACVFSSEFDGPLERECDETTEPALWL